MQPRLVETPLPVQTAPQPRIVSVDTGTQPRKAPARQHQRHNKPRHKAAPLWALATLIMAGLVFYGLYLGGGAIYERVITSTSAPDLVGSDVATAKRLASRANLQVEIIEVNHPTVPIGVVILQAPEVDTPMKKGDTVVLTVSQGPSAQQVPALEGTTTTDAIPLLTAAGLSMTVVEKCS